ncbi:MAG: GNAT family N-acetyltransferase [Dehalococcoidia bacterium]
MTQTQPRVVATGQLVQLREKHIDDAQRDYAWRRDPELAAYDAARPLSMSYRSFVSTFREELEHPSPFRHTFGIEDPATGRHIGNVMYYGYERDAGEAELGITIGEREYWSRGFGTDTVRTMLRYLFEELGLRRVYLHTLTWNDRAQQAFHRAGLSDVKRVHRAGYDFILMDITREQFEAGTTPA